MNLLTYFFIIFICFLVNYLFIYFKLYTQEKYKVSISLFISFNVLLTAYILLTQVNNHQEEIHNIIAENYSDYLNDIYSEPIKVMLKNKNNSQLFVEVFDNNKSDNRIVTNKIYKNLGNDLDYNSISNVDKAICSIINSGISNYALFYYTHLELSQYTILMKRQNYRMLKVINVYLKSPIYNVMLEYYLRGSCGLYTLKFFKEFYNISQRDPINKEEKLIAENIIIDGKVNGTQVVVAPTTYSTDIFEKEKFK